MLKSVFIKNYVLIDQLELKFSPDLNILTGETGAGKSLLLGALGLAMGKRFESKDLMNEKDKSIVELVFGNVSQQLINWCNENDFDVDDEIVLRREINAKGRSRAFINDTPVNLKLLTSISNKLIDIHRQFDTLDIQSTDFQLELLDSFAGNNNLLQKWSGKFQTYNYLKRKIDSLRKKKQSFENEQDYISFLLNEFEELDLQSGEMISLEEELALLQSANEITEAIAESRYSLEDSEDSILSRLLTVKNRFSKLGVDITALSKVAERMDSAYLELTDISRSLDHLLDDIDLDPQKESQVRDRLDNIYRLLQKHHAKEEAELLQIHDELQEKLGKNTDIEKELEKLESDFVLETKGLNELAQTLHSRRVAATSPFTLELAHVLDDLAMPNCQFKFSITKSEDFLENGMDQLVCLFSSNKGLDPRPLGEIASGGELSRLALAMKAIVADKINLPTIVFDEIDSGISGAVALKVGKILRRISEGHQVIAITHAPQVAAQGDKNFHIIKGESNGKTETEVKVLTKNEIVLELARMISGDPPSDAAKQSADELMKLKRAY
jgi:DNA repair protein RecN (Recombination protein N)